MRRVGRLAFIAGIVLVLACGGSNEEEARNVPAASAGHTGTPSPVAPGTAPGGSTAAPSSSHQATTTPAPAAAGGPVATNPAQAGESAAGPETSPVPTQPSAPGTEAEEPVAQAAASGPSLAVLPPFLRDLLDLFDDEAATQTDQEAIDTVSAYFTWRMPDRFDASWQTWDPVSRTYDPAIINQGEWTIEIDACPFSRALVLIDTYRVVVESTALAYSETVETTECQVEVGGLANLQEYRVSVSAHNASGWSTPVEQTVRVQDWLIVTIGDSMASGEGNPDVPGEYLYPGGGPDLRVTAEPVVWKDHNCHRSALGGQALAARKLEESDPHSSVTYINLACSGAEVPHLLDTDYDGQEDVGVPVNPPQLDVLERLLGSKAHPSRRIDALMLSIGVNDMRFSSIVLACAKETTFGDEAECIDSISLQEVLATGQFVANEQRLERIDQRLVRLDSELRERFWVENVYLTDYPADPFAAGCHLAWAFLLFDANISEYEASKIAELGGKLNDVLRGAAARHGWQFIEGMTEAFRPHYYCSENSVLPEPTYFVQREDSFLYQGTEHGTLHPNAAGHAVYADLLLSRIELVQQESPPLNCPEYDLEGLQGIGDSPAAEQPGCLIATP